SSVGEYEDAFFISPTLLRVIRVFRVGRILRLVKSAKGIRTLLFSLAVSLPALFNIGLLLGLVMFIYAIMGMNFFQSCPQKFGLNDVFNFDTFISSFILLFQMCTSAGWSDVLNGLISECPDKGSCREYNIAAPYLASYLIITFLVVINMYIAVILENFSQATEDVQQGLTPDDFDMYYEKWEKFDPKATKYIPLDQLSDFVDYLEEPLRLPKPNHFILVKLDIPICEHDRCYCRDILDALTKNFLGTSETVEIPHKENDKDKAEYKQISSTLRRQKEHYAARIIQKAYRNFKGITLDPLQESYDEETDDDSRSGSGDVDRSSSNSSGKGKRGDKSGGGNLPPPPSYSDVMKKEREYQEKRDTKGDRSKRTNGESSSSKKSDDRCERTNGQNKSISRRASENVTVAQVNETDCYPKTVELGPDSGIVA
ncbi:unnamed protein product, partial [Candidula unifasciata]